MKILGTGLVLAGIALAIYGGIRFLDGTTTMLGLMSTAAFAALLGTLGIVALFGAGADHGLSIATIRESVAEGLQDELEDLSQFRVNLPIIEFVTTLAAAAIFSILVIGYHKSTASWHQLGMDFNVILVGVFASAAVAFLVTQTEWFYDRDFDTPTWVYGIAAGALILSVILGLHFAEPMKQQTTAATGFSGSWQQQESYNYNNTRSYYFVRDMSRSYGGGGDISLPECHGKDCEKGLLLIALIALVVLIIIASAIVPHFWVVGGMMLITVMLMISLQEVLQKRSAREGYRSRYGY